MEGWIKLHRSLLDHFVAQDGDMFLLWVRMLLMANHKDNKFPVGNKIIEVKRGQLMTSRKTLSEKTGIQESKIERILKLLKSEHQIEQQSFSKFRLISITNYESYQGDEQQTNSKRTANEQQVNTNKNVKKVNNEKKKGFTPPALPDVQRYITEKQYSVNAGNFIDFYSSKGWMVGSNKMKDWKACVRTWQNREKQGESGDQSGHQAAQRRLIG